MAVKLQRSGQWVVFALLAIVLVALPQPLLARGGPDEVQFGRHNARKANPHVRYPGDMDVGFGTVRIKAPDKGPYVERCHWIAKSHVLGIPTGFTQRCVRYTD